MDLQQLVRLTTGLSIQPRDTGGTVLGYRIPNAESVGFRVHPPAAMIPGISHTNKYSMARRKRKRTYKSDRERAVHDVLHKNHWEKRQKLMHDNELGLQKEKVDEFLRNVHSGKKRKIRDVYGVTELRKGHKKRKETEEKTEKTEKIPEYETEIVKKEEAYTPDVTPEAEVEPEEEKTPLTKMYERAATLPPVAESERESALELFRTLAGYGEEKEPTVELPSAPPTAQADVIGEGPPMAIPAKVLETATPPPVTRAEIPSEMDVETAEPTEASVLETKAPPPVARAEIPSEMDVETTEQPIEAAVLETAPDAFDMPEPMETGIQTKKTAEKIEPVVKPTLPRKRAFKTKAKTKGLTRTRAERSKLFGSDVATKMDVEKPESVFSAGLRAVEKKQAQLGLIKEPLTRAPSQPPRRPPARGPPETTVPMPKKKTPKLSISKGAELVIPPKEKPTLTRGAPTEIAIAGKKKRKRRLTRTKPTDISIPSEPSPPKKSSPKKPSKLSSPKKRPAARRVRFREPRGAARGSDMKVAPTQQVTVTPTQQSTSGTSALANKIDELLKETRATRAKKAQKGKFAAAKKQYRALRKSALAKIKAENKNIRKRELEKIKTMPTKQRAGAKRKLSAMLKDRETTLKGKLPAKISTSGQLQNLVQQFKMLKI